MNELTFDLNRFADTWLSNPAGRLDFVKLIERTLPSVTVTKNERAVREWIVAEKSIARTLGVK